MDALYINVRNPHISPEGGIIDTLDVLSKEGSKYGPTPAGRSGLARLGQMLSAPADQGWPLLSFEAYEGAGKIPIRSDASLRRLLAAIQNLGLPVRDKELPAGGMAYHPPVLRFYLDGWAREPVADTTTVGGPEDAGNGATSADDIADAGEDDDLKRKRSKASPASPSPETRRQRPGPKRVKALPIRLGTNPHEDKVEQEVEDQERPYEAPRMAPQPRPRRDRW